MNQLEQFVIIYMFILIVPLVLICAINQLIYCIKSKRKRKRKRKKK